VRDGVIRGVRQLSMPGFDFHPSNPDVRRGGDPDPDPASSNIDDGNLDSRFDDDSFSNFSAQDQHDNSSMSGCGNPLSG
jgi:hypothetical protein